MRKRQKKKTKDLVPVQEAPIVVSNAKKEKVGIVKNVNSPVLGYTFGYGRDSFVPTEYDLSEIGRIEDVENMVRQAFKKKTGLMFKESYDFVGPNLQTVQYIKKRFKQIAQASGVSTQTLLKTVGSDLIRLSNAFICKVRDEKASGGKVRVDQNKKRLKPVAGYFPIPAETIEIKKNVDTGKIEMYRQNMPDGKVKEYSPDDIIHIFYDRRPGFNTGKPTIVPVIDDIRALRRIEQNIELLVYQHLFPLFHHKVGTKEQPDRTYQDGTKEVDLVRDEIEFMPSEGSIVTSYRHEVKAIGAESRAIRAEGYLEHFKKRVIAGLGISSMDLGEGDTANRATSETMSRAMIDEVKDFQQTLVTFFNEFVIKELLLEADFSFDPLDELNAVYLSFNEIDIDAKIKRENHNMLLYQGHVISETELRNAVGLEPVVEGERKEMFLDVVMKKQAEFQAAATMLNAGGTASGAAASAQSKQQPSNQHGTKSGPEKKKSSYIPKRPVADEVLKQEFADVISDIERSAVTGTFTVDWAVQLLSMVETRMAERLNSIMNKEIRAGVRSATNNPQDVSLTSAYKQAEAFSNFRIHYLINTIKKIVKGLDSNSPTIIDQVQKIYRSLAFRFDFILRTEKRRAFLLGKALGMKNEDHTFATVKTSQGACEDCQKQKGNVLNLDHIRLDDMPVAHDNCGCDFE